MNSEKLDLLKDEVEKIFGRKILSASDCQSLGVSIFDLTGFKISLNTLRRTFHLMTSKYQPSVFTLDLLAQYCGYASYSDFDARKSNIALTSNHNSDTSILHFLILLFKDFEIKNEKDPTYHHLIYEIINNLDQWPTVIDRFQCEVAKTVNGQKFYFEQFVNVDKLTPFFSKGLHYYLRENKAAEAQVFGHAVLCFHSWLMLDNDRLKKHYEQVMRYKGVPIKNPFTCGRFFASQLFAANINGNDIEPILNQARAFHHHLKDATKQDGDVQGFEFILSETLVLIREYQEALFYIDNDAQEKNNSVQSYDDLKLFESLRLFKAIALNSLGKAKKAKDILDTISTRNFYFLSRQFHSILYLSQVQLFQKRMFVQKQLDHLVNKTGFKKLLLDQKEIVSA